MQIWRSLEARGKGTQYETLNNNKGIAAIQYLKILLYLSVIFNRFYESSKLKNWMCKTMQIFTNQVTHSIATVHTMYIIIIDALFGAV